MDDFYSRDPLPSKPKFAIAAGNLLRQKCKRPDAYILLCWNEREKVHWIDTNLPEKEFKQTMWGLMTSIVENELLEQMKMPDTH